MTDYSPDEITAAVVSLQGYGLVRSIEGRGSTTKIEQTFDTALGIDEQTRAILTVLLLRGPAAPGDIRGWTERLHHFPDSAAVEACLRHLAAAEPPLVVKRRKRAGQRTNRWDHRIQPIQQDDPRPPTPDAIRSAVPPPSVTPVHAPVAPSNVDLARTSPEDGGPTDRIEAQQVDGGVPAATVMTPDRRPPMSRGHKALVGIVGTLALLIVLVTVLATAFGGGEATVPTLSESDTLTSIGTTATTDEQVAAADDPGLSGSERARVINEARDLASEESYAEAIIAARPLADGDRTKIRAYVVRAARRSVMVAVGRRRAADARTALNAAKRAGLTADIAPAQRAYTTFVAAERRRAAQKKAAAEAARRAEAAEAARQAEAAQRAREEAAQRARKESVPDTVAPSYDGLTCSDIRRPVVVPPGSHLDRDGDGIGCESYG